MSTNICHKTFADINIDDVYPEIREFMLKVGTFNINSYGMKMSEQFAKIIMDYAINEDVDVCYTTIFPKY